MVGRFILPSIPSHRPGGGVFALPLLRRLFGANPLLVQNGGGKRGWDSWFRSEAFGSKLIYGAKPVQERLLV